MTALKKLCLGTYLKILHQGLLKENKCSCFTRTLFSSFTNDERILDDDYLKHLKIGKYNQPDMSSLKTYNKDKLALFFKDKIIPQINPSLKKQIVLAFKDVLKGDDIVDTTLIGYEEGYEKVNILNSNYFNFPELLSNVFYYCVVSIQNTPYKNHIKEFNNKDYLKSFEGKINEIEFEEKIKKVNPSLNITVKRKSFDDTFEQVKGCTLSLPNSNEAKIFMLDVDSNSFDYKQIKDFIKLNICRYVYSRSELNKYTVDDNIEAVQHDAINAYKKRTTDKITTNHFNELMLYSFLECVLDAPKIYSKMELQSLTKTYDSASAGIHLLFMRKGITPFYQMVFGATNTSNDLKTAVDNAFNQIINIKESKEMEYKLVEGTIMNIVPDKEMGDKLEEIMIPKKASGIRKPSTAFGIFLGYTISIKDASSLSDFEYLDELKKNMEKDIIDSLPYIEAKIKSFHLESHSFYFYVLPLNDADNDTQYIMNDAMEVK